MFYPTGKKEIYKKTIIDYKNRGMELENIINTSNEYYLENDIAVIYKKPTPIGLVDVDYKKGEIKSAYFKEKSTLDYNGIYKGRYLDFDAKESHVKTSFPLSNISMHQIEHIRRVIKHDGIAFLIISINGSYFLLKGEELLKFIEENARKSIPYAYFKQNCKVINEKLRPRLDYLSAIDELYFKGE